MSYSLSGHIIVEEYIEKEGCSSDTDCMSIDGRLVFTSFNSQRFDANAINPYTPSAYSWPSTYTQEQESYLASEIQRLISLLGLQTVVYNIETRIGVNGKPYIMELTPRGGGNRLSEMIRFATGVDMITAITRAMVGDPILTPIEQKPYVGYWAEIILHSNQDGVFQGLELKKDIQPYIFEQIIWVKKGDPVYSFNGANNAIGTIVLRFHSKEEMEHYLTNHSRYINIKV